LDWSKAKAKDAKKPDEVKKIENGDASTKDREKPSATVDIKVKAEPKAMTADKRKAEVKAEDPPQVRTFASVLCTKLNSKSAP
jgi:hypothetical protein